jgi:ParB family transcriptional regulator, chromosome partitioning protein
MNDQQNIKIPNIDKDKNKQNKDFEYTQITLSLDSLQPNPFQPRDKIKKEDIRELADSITEHGLLEPLVVAHTPAGYQIIAGERRWRAAKMAGLKSVPVIIRETSRNGMLIMALIENVQREDLNPIEKAKGFNYLVKNFHFTHKQIAKKIGKSRTYICNSLAMLKLPDAVTDGLISGLITEGHARAIKSIPSEQSQIECYRKILAEDANVRRAETLARRYKKIVLQKGRKKKRTLTKREIQQEDAIYSKWKDQVQKYFNTKTKLSFHHGHNVTYVQFKFYGPSKDAQEEMKRILRALRREQAIEKREGPKRKRKAMKKRLFPGIDIAVKGDNIEESSDGFIQNRPVIRKAQLDI